MDVPGASRTAGFLTAISAGGIIVHLGELIGAESLSQRYAFLADVAQCAPNLNVVVHDDACHLYFMAASCKDDSEMAARLARMRYIVDKFHGSGHIGAWCKAHCMPELPSNVALLQGFPTSIAEVVNADLSPMGHIVHHYGRWTAQMVISETADVHSIKTLRRKREDEAASATKVAVKKRRAAKREGEPSGGGGDQEGTSSR